MANQFVNLPIPVGNGVGTPVDVSTFGAFKTVIVAGAAFATYNIEFNNAAVSTDGSWTPAATVQNAGQRNFNVAARWMRVRVTDYDVNRGGTAQVDLGGTDEGVTMASLPVPTGTGVGASVDVSAILGLLKTVQVGGAFRGTLIVEISEDGATEWAQPFSFQTPGYQNAIVAAKFMRVRRVGVPQVAPGTPIVNVGFATAGGGGGDEGVAISAGTSSQATGTVSFANSNGISFGLSAGTMTASIGGGGVALSAGSQSAATGTIAFANSNGVSFGMSGSSQITATHDGPRAVIAGTQTLTSGSLSFSNVNGVSFGMAGSATITASVAAQSTAPGGISAGTQLATSGTVVFSNSNGISFGMSGSSRVTANYASYVSGWDNGGFVINSSQAVSQGTMSLQKVSAAVYVSATQAIFNMGIGGASQSSGLISLSLGIYTLSRSTASLASSGSRLISWSSGSSAVTSQFGGVSGARMRTVPIVANITPGDYLFAYHVVTGGESAVVTMYGQQNTGVPIATFDGVETSQWLNGYSNSSFVSAMPVSIVVTDTNYQRTAGTMARMPGVFLQGTF